jgi:hypothetical protein
MLKYYEYFKENLKELRMTKFYIKELDTKADKD